MDAARSFSMDVFFFKFKEKNESYFKMLNGKGGTPFLKRRGSPTPHLGK